MRSVGLPKKLDNHPGRRQPHPNRRTRQIIFLMLSVAADQVPVDRIAEMVYTILSDRYLMCDLLSLLYHCVQYSHPALLSSCWKEYPQNSPLFLKSAIRAAHRATDPCSYMH